MEIGRFHDIAKKVVAPAFNRAWNITVEGLENVPSHGGAILTPNHTSVFDSFVVPAVLKRRITYVGKAEYLDDWKTRKLFPALGMIPIDRGGGSAAQQALDIAADVLDRGELFGIYPEGTRSRSGDLHRGHTGPARLALRCNVPLIPVGLIGTREVQPPDQPYPKPGLDLTVKFGKPIRVENYDLEGDERRVLRQIIDELMFEIQALTGQTYVDTYATKKKTEEAPKVVTPDPTVVELRKPAVVGPGAGEVDASRGTAASALRFKPLAPEGADGAPLVDRESSADVLNRRTLVLEPVA
jgi:1-acyl-sn-glycerol-3-phosphate acyltransferase